jgi:hypothetical protein
MKAGPAGPGYVKVSPGDPLSGRRGVSETGKPGRGGTFAALAFNAIYMI